MRRSGASATSAVWNTPSSEPFRTSRLDSGEAKPGQILLGQRVFAALEDRVDAVPAGERMLKGFHKTVPVFELVSMSEAPGAASSAAAGG